MFKLRTYDIYNLVAGHWGEENIIGDYVYDDETTTHILIIIVPANGGKINYKGVFVGDVVNNIALSQNISKLHNELAIMKARYGLTRDSNVTGKNPYSCWQWRDAEWPQIGAVERRLMSAR